MKNEDTRKRLYTLATAFIGIFVQTMIVFVVWQGYYNSTHVIRKIFVFRGHYFVMAIYWIVLYLFNKKNGSLKIGYLKIGDLIFSQLVSNVCANLIFYLELCLLAYGFPSPAKLLQAMLAQNLFQIIWVIIVTKGYQRIFPPHQVLLLFGKDSVKEFLPKLEARKDKFTICESIKINTEKIKSDPKLCRAIKEKMSHYNTVMFWDLPTVMRNEFLKHAYGKGIRIYVMPKISDIILNGSEQMHFFDSPLLLTRSNPMTLEERVLKRCMDILLSILLLLVTSPIMLLTAIAIKINDGGRIFYKQTRCTMRQKEFRIYKFRSMVENAERDGVARLATKKDDRITAVGRFIRATRIDELPQLINILRGDMSFVGPRPERPEIMKKYMKEIPEFVYRTKVKAGLTGYAQIFGKYNTTPYDKLKLDMYYVEHYSIRLDIWLLIQTIKIIFVPESTEGVKEGKEK
ncbi:MAG: exopolysaccharide biosynthesis polyprenyl glycosylphosphotransferase [Lachnospiraceae bacterium]|nr:exopolysaccharide biosynthesis polyprenyl glycosylphosphotransferase [Lachnospiraceae bacterium]